MDFFELDRKLSLHRDFHRNLCIDCSPELEMVPYSDLDHYVDGRGDDDFFGVD